MSARVARTFVLTLLASLVCSFVDAQPRPIDPLRFEEAIEDFEAQDAISPPPAGAIVVTGSSSIRRWHPTMERDLAPLTVVPRGFGGSTMQDVLHYVDRVVIAYRPRAVVIYEGDNDTGMYGVAPETIVRQFEAIVERIHMSLPETRIYVLSVKPSVARWRFWSQATRTNELLARVAAEHVLITYIDVATPMLDSNGVVRDDIFVADNLHLNETGTRIWAATVRAALLDHEGRYERPTGAWSVPRTPDASLVVFPAR